MIKREFAARLESERDKIIATWVERVRADERIGSDEGLSRTALIDHLPAMLEELRELLELDQEPDATLLREGRVHTYLRFNVDYRGADLIRELAILRHTLTQALLTHPGVQEETLARDLLRAAILIDLYIDEQMAHAMALYTESRSPTE